MDELSRDPELAPELVKLLSLKLKDARKALEESRKENEELRDQNAQLREANAEPLARGPGAREDMERQLEEVQHDLVESVRRHKMATQENNGLRDEVGRLHEHIRSLPMHPAEEDVKPLTSCLAGLCPAKDDIQNLHGEIDQLQTAFIEERDTRQRNEAELQALLKVAEEKKNKYKRKLAQCREESENHSSSRGDVIVEAPDTRRVPDDLPVDLPAGEDIEMDAEMNEPSNEGVKRCSPSDTPDVSGDEHDSAVTALQSAEHRPYVFLAATRDPHYLPWETRQLSNANGILYEPERTFYPYGDGNCARIIMPKTRCDTSTSPWTWYTPPEWDLGNIVGNAKEIFQLVSLGIRYVGTFQGVASGRFPVEEFVRLEKRTRDAVLKRAFASFKQYKSASAEDLQIVQDRYLSGEAELHYLDLELEGINRGFAEGLKVLKVQDESRQPIQKRPVGPMPISEPGKPAKKSRFRR